MSDNKWMVGFRRRSAVGVAALPPGWPSSRPSVRADVAANSTYCGCGCGCIESSLISLMAARLKHLERHDVLRRTTLPGYTDRAAWSVVAMRLTAPGEAARFDTLTAPGLRLT